MKTPILILAALAIATSGFANAVSCAAAPVDLTLNTPAGTYYVDNEECQPDCLFAVWIYQETNGREGLQREACEDENGRTVQPDQWAQ